MVRQLYQGDKWDGTWNSWDSLPGALQAALVWAWRCGGPETPRDIARLKVLEGEFDLGKILNHESIRWAGRLVKRTLPLLTNDQLNDGLGRLLGLSALTIRGKRNGKGRGWEKATMAARLVAHHHATDDQQRACPECKWIFKLGPGMSNVIQVPRMDGSVLYVERTPVQRRPGSLGVDRLLTMWAGGVASIFPGCDWTFNILRLDHEKPDGPVFDMTPLRTIFPSMKAENENDPERSWAELFKIANPEMTRIYLQRPNGGFFPEPPAEDLPGMMKAISKAKSTPIS